MANTAILAIRIISDARKAAKDLGQVESSAGKMQRGLQRAAPAAKATVLGLAAVGAASFKQASDLQQSTGAVESVFKRQAGAVKGLAAEAAGTVGLATSEYQDLAAVLGAQLGNLGVAQKNLVPTTDMLIKKGADLAATFGGTTADAVDALAAAFRGETDPIEKYGISIKQATVDAYLAKKGQDNLRGAAERQARTQAMLALVTEQSAAAQGAFARESDTAAGAQARATANLKNSAAALGEVLLPLAASVAQKLSEVARYVQENAGAFTILAAVVGGLAVTVLAVNAAMSAYAAISAIVKGVTIAYRNAQMALNLVMLANPVILVVLAIVALVAILVVAYKKSDKFRAIVQAAMAAVADAVGWVIDAIGDLIGWVRDRAPAAWEAFKAKVVEIVHRMTAPHRAVIGVIRDLIGWVRDRAVAAWEWLRDKATAAVNAIISPIRAAIGWVEDLLDKISNIRMPSFGFGGGGGLFGGGGGLFGSDHSPSLQAGGLTAAAGGVGYGTAGAGAGAPVVIHVHGALDPDAVARQIETLLGRRARRLGRA